MLRQLLALTTTPLALALTACSGAEGTDADVVSAGVAEQYEVLADEVAEKGTTVESGAWTVNLITETAEPWHEVHGGGHTEFRDVRAGETNHIEIIPVDTASGRIVPDVPIVLEVIDADGQVVAKDRLNFYGSSSTTPTTSRSPTQARTRSRRPWRHPRSRGMAPTMTRSHPAATIDVARMGRALPSPTAVRDGSGAGLRRARR